MRIPVPLNALRAFEAAAGKSVELTNLDSRLAIDVYGL